MGSTPTTRLRRDAGASIFAFSLAGLALVVHVIGEAGRWSADVVALRAADPDGLTRTVLTPAAELAQAYPQQVRVSPQGRRLLQAEQVRWQADTPAADGFTLWLGATPYHVRTLESQP